MVPARLPATRLRMLSALGAAGLVLFWSVAAASGIVPRTFLPTLRDVLLRLIELTHQPFAGNTLQNHLLSSLGRFALGFALAVAVGIPLGLLMAWFRAIDRIVAPVFEAVRFVAPIAWVPFAALWFGTGIGGPVLIIFLGAFPPVLINTYRGAQFVDRKYIEASRMLGAGAWRGITQVMLPAALPSIVSGLRISAGLGWQSLVGAELIVASSGVGYLMVKGQAGLSTATVMSGMIAIGIVGSAIDALLRRMQRAMEARRGL
ncbi:ABC transporter permease [Verminephrobacter aporrectodeae subsp. tuberculatae]|uniref:ABC transporter permease n=2 Tax=Verminephrobacter aporrectodeae TaxID=1110389 RepID=UPI0022390376|nr:ABC transporter permease [Verminephrobacter aporrectodeae]MCW5223184.1 ABC transporter permease [Verminephrobacter aporrectodeae subsp. tuberculatae]MCW5288648.1 ABC transporter permease [Verminephrobacter aporrectodeae subsp. tuberculatae]